MSAERVNFASSLGSSPTPRQQAFDDLEVIQNRGFRGFTSALYRLVTFTAGVHNVPCATYLASAPPDTVRVAFDQYGVIYPTSVDVPAIRQPRIGSNYAWSLRHELDRLGYEYGPSQIAAATAQVAESLKTKAKSVPANCMVVLIHGYNNALPAAAENYSRIRAQLQHHPILKPVYLEVFWDGMHRGPLTWRAPLLYWFDAMTYSNIAGQIGLRSLMNRRPLDLPVLFITHSRGAGVAFSCISDPVYDDHIEVGEYEASTLQSAPSVALVCLAPAVGNGHSLPKVRAALPKNSSLGIGFNERDPALQKPFVGAQSLGDTSLGTNEDFFLDAERATNMGSTWLYRSVYADYPKHDLQGYLEHEGGKPFNALLDGAAATLRIV